MKIFGIVMLIAFSFGVGCRSGNGLSGSTQGSGNVKTDSRNIVGFKKIKAESAITLDISITKGYSVVVKADDNVLASVLTELQGDTLAISLKNKTDLKSPITITVQMPEITGLSVMGAASATVAGVSSDEIKLEAVGASKIKIDGKVRSVKIKSVGASNVDASELIGQTGDAESIGASTILVSASDELNASASGASHVIYLGEPKKLTQNASDVSTIVKQ